MKRLWLRMPHRRFLSLLGIEFALLAIAPYDRKDWALENALVVVFFGALFASYRRLTLAPVLSSDLPVPVVAPAWRSLHLCAGAL